MATKPTYEELEQRIRVLEVESAKGKQVENALRESEEKYRLLVESAGEGIVLTQEGTFRYVNPRALEFMGYSQEEIIAQSMSHFVHPDDRERLGQLYLSKLAGEDVPPASSWRIISKSGTFKWVQSRSTLLTWEGKPSLLTFLIDITQQRQAEEALEEERRRLQKSLEDVRTLRGIVPICARCKKIRDDKGYWNQVEKYVSEHSEATFSHGICPECLKKLYPEFAQDESQAKP